MHIMVERQYCVHFTLGIELHVGHILISEGNGNVQNGP